MSALLLVLAPGAAQAGPLALIGNSLDGTVTVIDTAVSVTLTASPTNVTVTATIPLTSTPVAGIATNPVRAEAYVAALSTEGVSVLTVLGVTASAVTPTATVTQIVEIPLSVFEPIGVAVHPAGGRAYVTGGLTDNIVSVVNLDTRLEIATITLHPSDAVGPYGVAVHPDPAKQRVYVANSNSGTISVINAANNTVAKTITLTPCPVGCAPNKMAVSPDGSRLYVTDDFADVVWVINTTNETIVTSISGVQFPEGVAVHPDGSRLYVANVDATGAGQVTEILTATHLVNVSVPVGIDPIGIAVDRTGDNVLIVNHGDDTVTAASTADLTNQVVLPVGGAPATFGQFITAAVTGSIQFSSANYSVNEPLTGTANAVITVTRTGAPGATIIVPYATASGGTATAGTLGNGDYGQTSGSLTFTASGPASSSLTFSVPVFADSTAEGPETVNLVLGPPTGLAVLGPQNTSMLTIVDVSAGRVQLSSLTYSVNEVGPGGAATSAAIVVTRTNGTAGGATVDYATSDLAPVEAKGGNLGEPGIDYATTSGMLTFGPSVSSLTFFVPIVNDSLGEGNERFRVTLSNPSPGLALGTPATALVTIQDDEVVLQFSAESFVVSEDGGKATITVQRSGPPVGTVTVQYATSNGTATGGTAAGAGVDYINASGTLTFGPSVTQQTFTVTIVNDFVIEPDETVTLTLSNPAVVGAAVTPILGPRNPATLTITNEDKAGTLEFSAATYTVSEVAGTATIVVSRTGGLAEGVTVTFSTSAGTATPGADYTETTTVLTFAGGEASKPVTIPIINDSLVEPNETMNLTLSSPGGGGTLGPRSTGVLTIVSDDQPGVIEFSAPTYAVNEAAGPAKIIVTRSGGNASNVTVDYATSNGTAVAPGDYATTTGTLTFGAGVSSLTFLVPIVNDSEGEGPETVNLTLSNPGGGATLGARKTAVLTIVDDESTVQFSTGLFIGTEGTPGGVITVTRTGSLAGSVTVRYATSDDTATAFRDYSPTTGILTFPPNTASKTFTVPITDGSILEPDELVTLTLSNPTGALLGNPRVARLKIRDNDPGTLKFGSATYTVPEKAPGGKVVVTVQRTGSLNAITTVPFATIDGTATGGAAAGPGVDYISVATTLTFLPGETKKDVAITILDDTLAEGNETFIVRLGGRDATGAVTGVSNGTVNPLVLGEATVTIVDDDKAGTVQFDKPTFSVSEPTSGTVMAEITVTRTGGTAGPATVAYSTADGTATAGEDYTTTSGVLTFGFNEVKKTFSVPVLADSVVEGTETVRLTLSNPTGGLVLGPQATATLSILESQAVIQFSQLVFTVSESTPMATITVVRSGSVFGSATVRFRTVDGTATAPADYGNRSGVLTFAANATMQTFTVPIVNDDFFEPDETVTLVLSDPVGALLGQVSTATLVITDNDPPGAIGFSSDKFTVLESAKTAKITVIRTGGTARDITVQYVAQDITATGGPTATTSDADYVITSGTFTFGPKEAMKTFDVPIVTDDLAEGPETVRLRLLNPTGGATLGLAEAILTIIDDDKPGVIQFSAAAYTVNEAAASVTRTATIVVTRTGGTARGVTVAYQTNNGTATSGVDYGATSGVLSFGTGVTSLTFTIPVFGDADAEGDETFTVTLSNPTSGATLGQPSTAVVNIIDDESVIQFSSATFSVNEASPAAEITIVRSGSTAAAATVHFKTGGPGDTATPGPGAGADYTAQDLTVTFPAKSAVQKVLIPIAKDTLVEGNETVTLTLDSPAGGALIGPRGTATLTIVDNNQPGVIRFDKPIFQATEPATGSVLVPITISRTGTNLGGGVAVDLAVMDGTATGSGVDYALVNQSTTLTFAAGEAKKTVNITVFADSLVEDNETVILKLSNPSLGATLAPPTGAAPGVSLPDALLAIVSDDRPGVFQFSAATYTTSEALGATVNATITVNRIGTPATLASGVTVDYLITGGTASFGLDYSLPNGPATGGRLTFGAGVTSQTFNVAILPDTAGEGAETIVLTLANPSGGATLGTPSAATVNVNDSQTSISFASVFSSVPETGLAQIPIVRTGPVTGVTSTVLFTAVAGVATPGVDFTPTPPGGVLVTFPPGSTKQTVTLPIAADTIPEGNEFIVLVLTSPSPGTVLGALPIAFLTITDDDPGTFRFSSPTFSVKEGEPVAVISVTRTGTAAQLQLSQTASVSTTNGTAIAGTDYTAVSGQPLTFDPGVTTQTLAIPIADNELKDGSRTFFVSLLPVTTGTTVGTGGIAQVTIQDND